MPKKPVSDNKDDIDNTDIGDFDDEEPIPARRDIRIFHREGDDKKDKGKKSEYEKAE